MVPSDVLESNDRLSISFMSDLFLILKNKDNKQFELRESDSIILEDNVLELLKVKKKNDKFNLKNINQVIK